jgi:hypothetical protein
VSVQITALEMPRGGRATRGATATRRAARTRRTTASSKWDRAQRCPESLRIAMSLAALAVGCGQDRKQSDVSAGADLPCLIETMDCHLDRKKGNAGCDEHDPCCPRFVKGLVAVLCQADGGVCVTFGSNCIPRGWVLPGDGSVLPDHWAARLDAGAVPDRD